MQLKQLYFIAFQDYPHEVCLGLCAAHAVETMHALQGLGGCVAKSFKDVLSQKD